jgi:hypothetical protein
MAALPSVGWAGSKDDGCRVGQAEWVLPGDADCSELCSAWSVAVIDSFRPVTLPVTTAGLRPLPSAFPSAMTASPTAEPGTGGP